MREIRTSGSMSGDWKRSLSNRASLRLYYDNIDRLISMTNGTSNENYSFDGVGNRTASHLSATYNYQPFNRITSTVTANYGYDANGNMTTRAEGKEFWRYNWDYENRLVSASTRKQTVRYKYDALGRRIQRIVGNGRENTKFVYDGLDVVMDDNSGVLTKYQNGPGIDNKLKMSANGVSKYFIADHLGSTNALTDASGTVLEQTAYDSFGNATNQLSTRYAFTGREFDNFTGLHYYRARWYDSNLGRFISEDPIGFAGGDVNLYGYVGNGPLGAKDPMGLEASFWNEIADSADQSIEYATAYYQPDPHAVNANTAVNFVSYVAHGTVDLLRVGNGIAEAYYCEDTWEGRAAYVLMDVQRATGITTIVLGGAVRSGFSSPVSPTLTRPIAIPSSSRRKPFLPKEYYDARLQNRSPTQNSPFGIYERFDESGNLHQITTYDRFGSRVRQYDVGSRARHGEGYHVFEYDRTFPRQNSGGGRRSSQRNF